MRLRLVWQIPFPRLRRRRLRGRLRSFSSARIFDGAGVEISGIDHVVEQLRFGVIALLHGSDAAGGFDPLENKTDDVDGEGGRACDEGFFLYVVRYCRRVGRFLSARSARSLRMMAMVVPEGPRFFWAPA